jgi:hypothetical protein
MLQRERLLQKKYVMDRVWDYDFRCTRKRARPSASKNPPGGLPTLQRRSVEQHLHALRLARLRLICDER